MGRDGVERRAVLREVVPREGVELGTTSLGFLGTKNFGDRGLGIGYREPVSKVPRDLGILVPRFGWPLGRDVPLPIMFIP